MTVVKSTVSERSVKVKTGYDDVFGVLVSALDQSQSGKGDERHANNRPFDRQPIMENSRMYGPGGCGQQVAKKTQEAMTMFTRGEHHRAITELQGAIIYAAAMILIIRENKP